MGHIEEIEALGKSLASKTPWNEGDVETFVSILRHLRGKFGSGEMGISQEVCAKTLSVLTSLLDDLLTTPICRKFLDQTEGRDHLVLSVVLQCLVNCHSYMKTHDMPTSGEITAAITNTLLYSPDVTNWVYSLKSTTPIPLWRARIGYSAFVLITELITAALQSGIHPDFNRFLDHAAQCLRNITVYGGENVQLMQNWYEHIILLISALCNVTPREAYWQQDLKRPEHAVQLSSALGTILLLHNYEDGFKEIDAPSMVKLAELCMEFCGPLVNKSSGMWIKTVMDILKYCIYESPFRIRREQDSVKKGCNPLAKQLPDDNLPRMLGVLRGSVHLILHLLPPVCDPPDANWSMLDDECLSDLVFTIGDVMVLVDSLLQEHLSKQEPIGPRKKAPSLMSSMGAFSYKDPRSIAFAIFFKQELIQSLLSIIYYRPHMVPCFEKHIRVTSIECLEFELPVNAPDMFWALINSSQRDPSGVAAVEYTIVLLNRILKPESQNKEVLKASSVLAKRMAELKPVSTLREQVKSFAEIDLP
nr:protein EMSY [Hymenolepis microstoma]